MDDWGSDALDIDEDILGGAIASRLAVRLEARHSAQTSPTEFSVTATPALLCVSQFPPQLPVASDLGATGAVASELEIDEDILGSGHVDTQRKPASSRNEQWLDRLDSLAAPPKRKLECVDIDKRQLRPLEDQFRSPSPQPGAKRGQKTLFADTPQVPQSPRNIETCRDQPDLTLRSRQFGNLGGTQWMSTTPQMAPRNFFGTPSSAGHATQPPQTPRSVATSPVQATPQTVGSQRGGRALVLAVPDKNSRGWASEPGWASARSCRSEVQDTSENEDDESLLRRCRQEGPPGPASATLVVVGGKYCPGPLTGNEHILSTRKLCENSAWLSALKILNIPIDKFHLGAGAPPTDGSPMATHNLAAIEKGVWPPQRWHLVVSVQRIEPLAGETAAVVIDPTGEALATFDHRVLQHWPHAATEGSVLLLTNVVALPPPPRGCAHGLTAPARCHRKPRLLVMMRSLGRCFAVCDVPPEEAKALIAEAKTELIC